MEACKRILHQFLDGSDKRFVIPVYQRNYDWKTENCKRLLDDLVRVSKERSASHFFGGIVYFKPNVAGTDEYQIIDGQQRLTTVALFLLALKRLIEDGKIVVSDTALSSRINDYLVDKYAPETSKIKLKPINEDDDAFRRFFGFGGRMLRQSVQQGGKKEDVGSKTVQETGRAAQETTQENMMGVAERILDMVRKTPFITTSEMANRLGMTRSGVNYHLATLKRDFGLHHEGPTKKGRWILPELR